MSDIPVRQSKAEGIAKAALILGICGFIPIIGLLPGLIGVILGVIALALHTSSKGRAVGGIITGIFFILVWASISILTKSPSDDRVKCAINIHFIGRGLLMYADDNNDAYPPDLERIIKDYLKDDRKLFKCPSTDKHRDCDYFYFPPPRKTSMVIEPGDTIIACDYRDNHSGKGRNMLFADGHVDWMTEEEFQQKLQMQVNTAFAAALRKAEGP